MNSTEHIIKKLNELIVLFPKIKVRYENHIDSKTHFIEVIPAEIYHLDKEYNSWENDFFDLFTNKYYNENICFISNDSNVKFVNIIFQGKGKYFDSISSVYEFEKTSEIYNDNYKINIKNNSNSYSQYNFIICDNSIMTIKEDEFYNTQILYGNEILTSSYDNNREKKQFDSDNTSYALAA